MGPAGPAVRPSRWGRRCTRPSWACHASGRPARGEERESPWISSTASLAILSTVWTFPKTKSPSPSPPRVAVDWRRRSLGPESNGMCTLHMYSEARVRRTTRSDLYFFSIFFFSIYFYFCGYLIDFHLIYLCYQASDRTIGVHVYPRCRYADGRFQEHKHPSAFWVFPTSSSSSYPPSLVFRFSINSSGSITKWRKFIHTKAKKMAIRFGSMKDINIPIIYLLYVCMCSISNIGGYFFFHFLFFW